MAVQEPAGAIRTPDQRLRVFISSTLGELAEERLAARRAVEQLRLAPIMFELGARPHPPRALYRSYLEQSDVFVGIYWQRYGWLAPDMEISGLEDEFVLSHGMPRLVYVKHPSPDRDARLGDLLGRLKDEDTTSYKPFRDADQLEQLLLDDLAIMLTERFDRALVPGGPAAPRNNLPRAVSTFLGREPLLDELGDLLHDDGIRLMTLTGPGGVGKTRLALEAAGQQFGHFEDGVFFVDLSGARVPEDVYDAIVQAIPVGESGRDAPLDALKHGLREHHVLLVLDNFEQVTMAAADVSELLEHCPQLHIMVTSREALRVRGEQRLPVPPLSLPPTEQALLFADVGLGSEAVRLFGERAAAVRPDFEITDANVADVAAICDRLDGLPLAIELAAARVSLFAVDELRARLVRHAQVLGRGGRDLPERQQTLRRTIEWSDELLTEPERTVLNVCSVFRDARIADVEATTARVTALASLDVIESVGSLVDKSLLCSTSGADGRPRFSMLKTIRDYAAEQLDRRPDLASGVRRAHAEHYSELAASLRVSSNVGSRDAVVAALSSELGNLRAAWSYWVADGDIGRLNDLLKPLWGYYDASANYRVVLELGDELLGVLMSQPPTPERAAEQIALETSLARMLMAVSGFSADVERRIRAVLDLSEAAGETPKLFPALRSLASLYLMRSDFASGAAVVEDLLVVAERQQDPALLSEAHLACGLNSLWGDDDMPGALRHLEEAVTYSNATTPGAVRLHAGPHTGVTSNIVSGLVSWMAGFPDRADASVARALEVAREIEHPYSIAYALFHAGLLELWREDVGQLASRASELLHLADTHDYPIWQALAHVLRGASTVAGNEADVGLAEVRQGLGIYQGLSTPPLFWPALLTIHAGVNLMAGRVDEARAILEDTEGSLDGNDPLVPGLVIMHGDVVRAGASPDRAAAEGLYRQAADLARANGLKMIELQAATRLATLQGGTPGEQQAVDELREVLDTFTEGFATAPLVAARAAVTGGLAGASG